MAETEAGMSTGTAELPGCWWPTCTRNAARVSQPGLPRQSCCILCPAGHTPACDGRNGEALTMFDA